MKRVLILGCPASGKSTFARALAVSTGLPVVHLDRLYWRANWIEAAEEEFHAQLAAELAKDVWIMDGNYSSTIAPRLALADTAIFLDFPRWLCLWRAVRRVILGQGRGRPDMAPACRERFDPSFFYFLWKFHETYRPKLVSELDRFSGETIVLRSPAEAKEFLEQK